MSAPLHRDGDVLVQLNDHRRIVFNRLQWILQVRQGRESQNDTGWRGDSYCCYRSTLLRCIEERCKDVDPVAFRLVEAFPEVHPRVARLRRECRS